MTEHNLSQVVEEVLSNLTEREKEILRKRFDIPADQELDSETIHRYIVAEGIGKDIGETIKAIKEIEQKALRKLKRNHDPDIA